MGILKLPAGMSSFLYSAGNLSIKYTPLRKTFGVVGKLSQFASGLQRYFPAAITLTAVWIALQGQTTGDMLLDGPYYITYMISLNEILTK